MLIVTSNRRDPETVNKRSHSVIRCPQFMAKEPAFFLLSIAFLISGFLGCKGAPKGTVVATVGDSHLTLQTVEARIPLQLNGKVSTQEKQRMVSHWVDEELLYQEALRLKLDEDPVVSSRIADAMRDVLVTELKERKFERDVDVLEGEIHDYYETHQEQFIRDQPEIRVRHILVQNNSALTRAWDRLRSGHQFDLVAREESIDISAENGGSLGYFMENQVDPTFWEACQKARLGKPSKAVTRLGHHVIEVMDRRETGSMRDLLEVRGEITQRILAIRRQEIHQRLLDELKAKNSWSIAMETSGQ